MASKTGGTIGPIIPQYTDNHPDSHSAQPTSGNRSTIASPLDTTKHLPRHPSNGSVSNRPKTVKPHNLTTAINDKETLTTAYKEACEAIQRAKTMHSIDTVRKNFITLNVATSLQPAFEAFQQALTESANQRRVYQCTYNMLVEAELLTPSAQKKRTDTVKTRDRDKLHFIFALELFLHGDRQKSSNRPKRPPLIPDTTHDHEEIANGLNASPQALNKLLSPYNLKINEVHQKRELAKVDEKEPIKYYDRTGRECQLEFGKVNKAFQHLSKDNQTRRIRQRKQSYKKDDYDKLFDIAQDILSKPSKEISATLIQSLVDTLKPDTLPAPLQEEEPHDSTVEMERAAPVPPKVVQAKPIPEPTPLIASTVTLESPPLHFAEVIKQPVIQRETAKPIPPSTPAVTPKPEVVNPVPQMKAESATPPIVLQSSPLTPKVPDTSPPSPETIEEPPPVHETGTKQNRHDRREFTDIDIPVTIPLSSEGPVDLPKAPSAEPPVAPPVEPPIETPVEPPIETPVEPPIETPIEPPLEVPEIPVEAPLLDVEQQQLVHANIIPIDLNSESGSASIGVYTFDDDGNISDINIHNQGLTAFNDLSAGGKRFNVFLIKDTEHTNQLPTPDFLDGQVDGEYYEFRNADGNIATMDSESTRLYLINPTTGEETLITENSDDIVHIGDHANNLNTTPTEELLLVTDGMQTENTFEMGSDLYGNIPGNLVTQRYTDFQHGDFSFRVDTKAHGYEGYRPPESGWYSDHLLGEQNTETPDLAPLVTEPPALPSTPETGESVADISDNAAPHNESIPTADVTDITDASDSLEDLSAASMRQMPGSPPLKNSLKGSLPTLPPLALVRYLRHSSPFINGTKL